jgi:hypothetical protein
MKHFTDQEIAEALRIAPKTIQDTIFDGQTVAVTVANIGKVQSLHIDQIGIIAELNRNMLLGLVNPQEFLNELIAAKVPEKDAREIMTEINQKIFVPLREEMKKGPVVATEPPAEIKPPPAPTPQPPRHQNFALRDALALVTKTSQPQPVESGKLLEDHEEPHIEFSKPSVVPSIVVPLPPPSAPNRVPSLATANSQQPTPLNNPPGGLSGEHSVKQNVLAAKPYSTDPYREPVDEK